VEIDGGRTNPIAEQRGDTKDNDNDLQLESVLGDSTFLALALPPTELYLISAQPCTPLSWMLLAIETNVAALL